MHTLKLVTLASKFFSKRACRLLVCDLYERLIPLNAQHGHDVSIWRHAIDVARQMAQTTNIQTEQHLRDAFWSTHEGHDDYRSNLQWDIRSIANELTLPAIDDVRGIRNLVLKSYWFGFADHGGVGAINDRIREFFFNPLDPVSRHEIPTSPTIQLFVQVMYERNNFAAMPILGDLLEDAGPCPQQVLDHCHGPHEHVRGCWVLELCRQ